MNKQNLESVVEYLKNNHPKKAIEISDCLELLNMSLESALDSLNSDMQIFMKEKNYQKLRQLTDVLEEISNVQSSIEYIFNFMKENTTALRNIKAYLKNSNLQFSGCN